MFKFLDLPVSEDCKRVKSGTEEKEFKLFKLIDNDNRPSTKIILPESRNNTKVVLLSDLNCSGSVAEAVLMDDKVDKIELSQLRKNPEISLNLQSLQFNENDANSQFVYDIYRMDLGRFTQTDIENKYCAIEIVTYEQEFLDEEDGSESDIFEDEDDSNAEDYFANDYPDEDSYLSDHDRDFLEGDVVDEDDSDADDYFFSDSELDHDDFFQEDDELDYYDSYVDSDEQDDFDGLCESNHIFDDSESN